MNSNVFSLDEARAKRTQFKSPSLFVVPETPTAAMGARSIEERIQRVNDSIARIKILMKQINEGIKP